MQKLLVAFVSVVTLMGLVAPSACAIQERNGDRLARGLTPLVPTRRDGGKHPQPSHHFKHKNHDQHEQRDLSEFPPTRRGDDRHPQPSHHFKHKNHDQHEQRDLSGLPPTRRDHPNHPQPSHHFKHKGHGHDDDQSEDNNDHGHNHQERNSDRLARGLPPLPPARRDSARHPHPSHQFKHKHLGHGDGDHGENDPPARRDNARHPQPSHHFKHKHHGHGDDDQGENDHPTRRDNARHPQPSHHFKHKHNGHDDDENDHPTRRDSARHPRPSHQFKHKHNGHDDDENDHPTRRDSARHPRPSHQFKFKYHGHGDDGENDNDQGHKHQERNSDRLARGLPPLPPNRRSSATRPQPSHHFEHKHQGDGAGTDNRIEIRDTDGKSLGYLTDFTGSGQDLSVNYNPGAHTLSFHGNNVGDAHFLGASVTDLSSNSPTFVYLTNVKTHDHQANADIWTLNGNQLTATWKNSDGTTAPVHLCLNSAGNSIVLAGSVPAGYKEVYFNLDK